MVATVTIECVYKPQTASDEKVVSAKKDISTLKVSGDRKGQSSALLALADAYLSVESAEDAFGAAKDSVPLMKEQGNKEGEGIAKLLMVKARCAADRAGEAAALLEDARALLEGNKKGSAAVKLMDAMVKFGVSSYSNAEALATEAIDAFKAVGDKTGEAASQLELSKISLTMGLTRNALKAGEAAATLFSSTKETLGEAKAKISIAKVFAAKKNAKEALKYSEEASKMAQDLKAGKLEVEALKAQVDVHIAKKKPELAIELLEKAKASFRSKGDKKSEAYTIVMLQSLYMENEEDFDKALELCKDAIALFQQVGDQKGELEASMAAAECHFQMSELDEACTMAKEAMNIARETGMKKGELKMLAFLVDTFVKCDAHDDAQAVVNEAMVVYEGSEDKRSEAAVYVEAGNVSSAVGFFKAFRGDMGGGIQALDASYLSFQTARDLSVGQGDFVTAGTAMQGHSFTRYRAQQIDQAVGSIQEAVGYFRVGSDKEKLAYALSQQCELQFALAAQDASGRSRPMSALAAANEAYEIFSDLGLKKAKITAMNTVANAYLSLGDPQGGWKAATSAVLEATTTGNKTGAATAYLMLAGSHLAEGNYYDARDAGNKARDLFSETGDASGESTAKDFVDNVDKYEKGQFNHYDFGGFTMQGPKPGPDRFPKRAPAPKETKTEVAPEGGRKKKKDDTQRSDIDIFNRSGGLYFQVDSLEARKATGNVNKRKGEDKTDPFSFQRIQARSESEQGRLKNLAGLL